MRRDRICMGLEEGSTIESADGKTLWTKIYENTWSAGGSIHWTDREMDVELARGAQLIIVDKGLTLQAIPVFDLEAGDYVVVTWGFWHNGDGAELFDQARSQVLMRVAGWNSSHDDCHWIIMLDAPEDVMNMIDWSQYQGENGYDRDPVLLYVGPDTVFHYVEKGQQHETWDDVWDWSDQYEIVDPPAEPVTA